MICTAGWTSHTDSSREVHPEVEKDGEKNETLYDGCLQG